MAYFHDGPSMNLPFQVISRGGGVPGEPEILGNLRKH